MNDTTIIHDGTAALGPVPPVRTLKVARNAAECLEMAADQIERHGLVCNEWGDRDGPSCVVAAIHCAAGLTVADSATGIVGTVEELEAAGYRELEPLDRGACRRVLDRGRLPAKQGSRRAPPPPRGGVCGSWDAVRLVARPADG